MINETAIQMYESVSPIYEKSKIMQSIFEVIGTECENDAEFIELILKNIFPQTADSWGITIWEQRLGIISNGYEHIEKRRSRIITKLQSRAIITPDRMAYIIKNYIEIEPEIEENVSKYAFDLYLKTNSEFSNVLLEIIDIIKKVKPSHLAYNIIMQYITNLNIYASFKEWFSDPIPLCGTIDCSYNSHIATNGKSNNNSIYSKIIKGICDSFVKVSDETFIVGNGKRLTENLELTINNFLTDELIKISENLYLSGVIGKSLENIISDKINSFISDELLMVTGTDYKEVVTIIKNQIKEFHSDILKITSENDYAEEMK